jgi:hypothetical protein
LKLSEIFSDKDDKLAILEAIKRTYNPHPHHHHLFSQFDMVMIQLGFLSIAFLFPTTLDIRDTRGVEGVHLWAVIGRMLGTTLVFIPVVIST